MKYTFCIFLFLFSSILIAHPKDQKGYVIAVPKRTLSELPNENIFTEVTGNKLDSLESLKNLIEKIDSYTQTPLCLINTKCYTKNMTLIKTEDIPCSIQKVKCISGLWLTLPAWITLLFELTMIEHNNSNSSNSSYRNPLLFTKFLKNESDVHLLKTAIHSMGLLAQGTHYNKKHIILDFGSALTCNNGSHAYFLCQSPYENEAYNIYLNKLKHFSSVPPDVDETFPLTSYEDHDSFTSNNEDGITIQTQVEDEDSNIICPPGIIHEPECKLSNSFLECSCENRIPHENEYVKLLTFLEGLSTFTHNESVEKNLLFTHSLENHKTTLSRYRRNFKHKNTVRMFTDAPPNSKVIKHFKALDQVINSSPYFFDNTTYDESIFFFYGEQTIAYHPDILIDHTDMQFILGTQIDWFDKALDLSIAPVTYLIDRCLHYDSIKIKALCKQTALLQDIKTDNIVYEMLLNSSCLPISDGSFETQKKLKKHFKLTCKRSTYKPPKMVSRLYRLFTRCFRCDSEIIVTDEDALKDFEQNFPKTYQLSHFLLHHTLQNTIQNNKKIHIKRILCVQEDRLVGVTPNDIHHLASTISKYKPSSSPGGLQQAQIHHFPPNHFFYNTQESTDNIDSIDANSSHIQTITPSSDTAEIHIHKSTSYEFALNNQEYGSDSTFRNDYFFDIDEDNQKACALSYIWAYNKHNLITLDRPRVLNMLRGSMYLKPYTQFDSFHVRMTHFVPLPNVEFYQSDTSQKPLQMESVLPIPQKDSEDKGVILYALHRKRADMPLTNAPISGGKKLSRTTSWWKQ